MTSHLDKGANYKSASKSRGHASECVLEFPNKRENEVPWVAFFTTIVTNPHYKESIQSAESTKTHHAGVAYTKH